jgi:hypothetical protein
VSDTSLPDDAPDLPDLSGFGVGDERAPDAVVDPVIVLTELVAENGKALGQLTAEGVAIADSHTLISSMIVQGFLEEILRRLAGEEVVVQLAIRIHRDEIAPMLVKARSQVTQAKLAPTTAMPSLNGVQPNRAQRRG